MVAPKSFFIRMYNVGFGDCLLLTFDYGTSSRNQPTDAQRGKVRKRHILFDHGSTSRARTRLSLAAVAKQVARDSAGNLDALVVTHRHKDHLSGLGTKAGKAILDLAPTLVVRSWTEDPKLAADAGKAASLAEAGASMAAATGVQSTNAQYLAAIAAGQELAADIERRAAAAKKSRTNLAEAADNEVTNADAVEALDLLSRDGAGEYVYAARETGGGYRGTRLAELLPGVKVTVLGPPRPSDWPDVVDQAAESAEFWIGAPAQVERAFAAPTASKQMPPPGTGRWIIDRMQQDEPAQLLGLVRWLDDVLNNTSVILLFEVGRHKLLFGGDAQIENWSWALKQADDDRALKRSLSQVTAYKVGHHGSRNATPISLFKLWKGQDPARLPFVALLSTKRDFHGEGSHAVPRSTLVTALKERGRVLSTDDDDVDWIEVAADVGSRGFAVTTGLID